MSSAAVLTQGQRAIDAAEKEQRRNAILNAAESLFVRHPERLASVAEVAQAANLAKGTVYLYFSSKEELLLALHGRHLHIFFRALFESLERPQTLTIEDMLRLTQEHIVHPPAFLPLTALCLGLMEKSVTPEVRARFFSEVAELLARGGEGLERHFPALPRGSGARLLNLSYALIVGMHQLVRQGCVPDEVRGHPSMAMFVNEFSFELEQALRALWSGYLGQQEAASTVRSGVSPRRELA